MARSPEHEVLWKGAPGVAEPLPGSGEIEPIDGLDWSSRTSVQEFRIQWVVVQHLRAEVGGKFTQQEMCGSLALIHSLSSLEPQTSITPEIAGESGGAPQRGRAAADLNRLHR